MMMRASAAALIGLLASLATLGIVLAGECPDADEALSLHNRYRARHGARALRWSRAAQRKAEDWTRNLASTNDCHLRHSTSSWRDGMGENLYAMFGTTSLSCSEAIEEWYNEESLFDFGSSDDLYSDNSGNFGAWGHFTQIIWAGTTSVGCARTRGDNCVVVACHYQPGGNVLSDSAFEDNVRPGGSKKGKKGRKLLNEGVTPVLSALLPTSDNTATTGMPEPAAA